MYRRKVLVSVFLLFVNFSQLFTVECNYIRPQRVKRAFFDPVTSTVYQTVEQRHYVPASCVYVEPNLPDCRNVRFLNFPSFNQNAFNFFNKGNEANSSTTNKKTNDIEITKRADDDQTKLDQNKTVAAPSWGEYLGFYQSTVTETKIIIQPTTVVDSRIVVTFAVKGCKPRDLPSNLERCPEDDQVDLIEVLPTSTVRARIEATQIPERISSDPHNILDSSKIDNEQELVENNRATKSL